MSDITTTPRAELPPAFRKPPLLTQRGKAHRERRLRRWIVRGSWRIWEACDITWNVFPLRGIRGLNYFGSIRSDWLCNERAERDVIAGVLPLVKNEKPFRNSWIRPIDFCTWVATKTHFVGEDRAAIFADFASRSAKPLTEEVGRQI